MILSLYHKVIKQLHSRDDYNKQNNEIMIKLIFPLI